jgi:hypothetical protein
MDARQRAAWRRKHWKGGVAKLDAMEDVDLDWWLTMTPDERLSSVFEMYDEQMALKEPGYEAPSRLPRSVGGVRPRRG